MKSRLNKKIDNEIPEGYKLTKAGIIPNEWSEMKLSQVLDKTKLGGNYENTSDSDGLPLIKMGNIGRGNIVLDNLNYIKSEEADCDDRLKEGDILFNTRNTLELVGKVAIWKNELPEAYYNSNLLMLKFKDQFVGNNYFMNYQFNSFSMVKKLRRIATGTTSVAAIYTKDLTTLSIAIPSIPEQHKIANILSTWDKAIELKEKLIEEKKKQKSGLMQKLLTGKVRLPWFDGEWEFAELSTVCDKVTRCIDKPNEPYYRLGLRSHAKGTFHEYVENPDDNSMDKLYIVKENDLIVNITFAWEHAIALAGSNDDGKLVSHRFPTYLFKDNADPRFYKHYVMQSKFKKMLDDISPGGAGRNRVMNQKSFLKLMVHIPSLEEQKAIANVLDLLNKEISLHQSELDSLKQQKKGLMQLLLTGIVRVTVETN